MAKPKIYLTGNETLKGEYNISHYVFEKDDSFLDWLAQLLVEVFEMPQGEQRAKFIFKTKEDEEGKWIKDEIYAKEIKKMIDIYEKYSNNLGQIDVFYGKNRVYMALRKSREIREKFSRFVFKTRDWIKIKEIKELPIYASKRVKQMEFN
jgi:hypothetical protein